MKKAPFILAAAVAIATLGACTVPAKYTDQNDAARAAGVPFLLHRISVGHPNSAAGVDISIDGQNLSNKSIKYIRYWAGAFDGVGEPVRGTIRRKHIRKLVETGPIAPGKGTNGGIWENSWYNHSIRCATVTKVEILYMDGTSKTYSGYAAISKLLRPGTSNSCRV